MAAKKQLNPILKLVLDIGPLILFFAANSKFGIFAATAGFMVAVLIALAVSYVLTRHIEVMPIVTAIIVLIFGGLTLYLKNEMFIKIKVTVLYGFFAAVLIGGLFFKRLFIKYVFAQAFELDESGWRQLTWRWGIFFLVLAVLNELVWRNASTDIWVDFKTFWIIPLIFLFALAQTPLVMKHHIEPDKTGD